MIKVCKFGGTSMADGITMAKVRDIVQAEKVRRYIVVSAPGKRFGGDTKVTDLLYASYRNLATTGELGESFQRLCERFVSIVEELGLNFDIQGLLSETRAQILAENSEDFTASRGEYLSGRIMAEVLGFDFIDARDVVKFNENGKLDGQRSYTLLANALKGKKYAVVAGFYGEDIHGKVKTFSRGGSDITGSIVARAVGANLYENWTDVSGFLTCDPRIIEESARIQTLSYKELRELSYMGADVLHSDAIFPVREVDIPICIKNTFRPEDEGTDIIPTSRYKLERRGVTGIAGKKNFTVIFVEKSMMNQEVGFTRKILTVLEEYHVSFEHMPSGIDTMSFVIDSSELKDGVLEQVLGGIQAAVSPDNLRVHDDIALVAVVGHGMSSHIGTSARVFGAIAKAGINVRMIDQGSSELNIIIGVDNVNYERTIRAVYDEFFK